MKRQIKHWYYNMEQETFNSIVMIGLTTFMMVVFLLAGYIVEHIIGGGK